MIEALVAALVLVAVLVVAERARRERLRQHREQVAALLLTSVGPAVARADGRELLGWRSVATALREVLPDAVRDHRAGHGSSPFRFRGRSSTTPTPAGRPTGSRGNGRHDIRFRQRASALEAELRGSGRVDTASGQARLAALDDEKLQDYQCRYEEYVRVGKALAALAEGGPEPRASAGPATADRAAP